MIINAIRNIELQDDESATGGIAFIGETLGDFMDEVGLDENATFEEINHSLEVCGIKKIF